MHERLNKIQKFILTTKKYFFVSFGLMLLSGLILTSVFYFSGKVNVARAAVPQTFNFQGKLTKVSDGTNVLNGNYSMQFKLYDATSTGNLLWTETWDGTGGTSQVNIVNGVFTVKLGTYTSLSNVDFTSGNIYLSINFNSGSGYDGEMSPRKQLLTAPFAFNANALVGTGRIGITYTSTTTPAAAITYNPGASTNNNALLVTSGSNVTGAAFSVVQNGSGYAALFTGGAVGIGTVTPTATLYVQGTSSAPTLNPFMVASSSGSSLFVVAPNGSTTISSLTSALPVRSTSSGNLFNGAINLASPDVTGNLPVANGGTGSNSTTTAFNNLSPLNTKGDLLTFDGTNNIRFAVGASNNCLTASSTTTSGLAWASCSAASGAITSLNGLTTASQTFATGTSGTIFNISSVGSVHTFNLPFASNVNTGQLQATDWLTFNNKLSVSLTNGFVIRATGASTTVTGILADNGTVAGVNATSSSVNFLVQGTANNNPFQVNSSTGTSLLTILGNGNVGIGTSTPQSKLAVQGTYVNFSDANGIGGISIYPNRNSSNEIFSDFFSGSARPLSLGVYGVNEQMINLSTNGNVGIGTTTPAQKLDVYGGASIGPANIGNESQLRLLGTQGSFNSGLLFGSTNTPDLGQFKYTIGTGDLSYNYSSNGSTFSSLFTIKGSGNTGVGTTTPGQLFTVAGSARVTGALYDGVNNSAGSNGNILMTTGGSTQWVATSTLFGGSMITGSGTNGYVTRWTSLNTQSTGILLDNGSVAGVNATSSSYTFNIKGSSGIAPFQITSSSGTSLVAVDQNGNLGIGTTGPVAPLTVAGLSAFGSPGAELVFIRGVSTQAISFNRNPNTGVMTDSNSFGYQLSHNASTSAASDNLSWGLYNSVGSGLGTVLSMTGAGNVGIGTTTPGSQLTVVGKITAFGNSVVSQDSSGLSASILQSSSEGYFASGGGIYI